MKSSLNFIVFLIIFSSFVSFSEAVRFKKTRNTQLDVISKVTSFAGSATSLLKDVSAAGQEIKKKLTPLKEYYVALEGVLGDFKNFLVKQTNIVTPSVSDSATSFSNMEQKFNQIYNLGQTVTEAINKYGGMLAKISPDSASKLESVTQEVNSIFDQVTKYKGYADKINQIIKEINEKFYVMKEFDDTKITELQKFVADFDKITDKLDTANKYVEDLTKVTSSLSTASNASSKVSEITNTAKEAANSVKNFFGGWW